MMRVLRTFLSLAMVVGLLAFQVPSGYAQIIPAAQKTTPAPAPAVAPMSRVQLAGGQPNVAKPSVEESNWPKLSMPKLSMPDLKVPKLKMPSMSKVLSPVSVGYQKVTSGTKKAWEGTKEMLTFGGTQEKVKTAPSRRTASSTRQSLWQKLTTRSQEPVGPQTVGEWMHQPRLQP